MINVLTGQGQAKKIKTRRDTHATDKEARVRRFGDVFGYFGEIIFLVRKK